MKLGKCDLFHTPKNHEELTNYIKNFTGGEGVVANTVYGMTWNLCADLTNKNKKGEKLYPLTANDFVEVIRKINCFKLNDFMSCFGEFQGDHFYRKFHVDLNANTGRFICMLDLKSLELLIEYRRGE